MHVKDFLDWLNLVEKFFDYVEIVDDKKMKLIAYKLSRGASVWWVQL